MFFVITTLVENKALDMNAAAADAHDAYLNDHASRLLVAGSLVHGDGASIGSLYILEADNLSSAAQFVEADPMTASGAVSSIDIVEWRMTNSSLDRLIAGWRAEMAEAPPTSSSD